MMFSYIASVLGFQGQSNSTKAVPEGYVSCRDYGWAPLPDPAVRLRVASKNSSVVRIFGYSPQEDFPKSMRYPPSTFGRDGPYIRYLLGESPASVKYVMGDDWRSQLWSDHPPRPRALYRDGDVVLGPHPPVTTLTTVTTTRMSPRKQRNVLTHSGCGAAELWQFTLKIHAGGVWVSRAPWLNSPPELPADRRTDEEILENNTREVQEINIYAALAKKLKRQENMEDVCRVLQESGAQFYAASEDCPEAVELNLCG